MPAKKKSTAKRPRLKRGRLSRPQLLDIKILRASSVLGVFQTGKLPTIAKMENSIRLEGISKAAEIVERKVIFDFSLAVMYDQKDTETPSIGISASICLQYRLSDSLYEALGDEEFVEIALETAWHFWRDHVQYTTLKMGFPGFPIVGEVPAEFRTFQKAEPSAMQR